MRVIGRLTLFMAAIFAVVTSAAWAGGQTTADRTICDYDGDNRLEYCQPEERVVREDLGEVRRDRALDRESLVNFAHLADFQLVDPESPLHMEFADPFIASADRPQQEAVPQMVEAMVQQLKGIKSPIDGVPLDFVALGGDNADSAQYNETRAVIDTLDGETVKTDSGRMGIEYPCSWPWLEKGSNYAGPRGSSLFWEPDFSGNGIDGPGYSPNADENLENTGTKNAIPDFPGFLEAANQSFKASGLDVPWYALNGNHDELIVGNFSPNTAGLYEELNGIATGCMRIMAKDKNKPAVRSLASTYKNFKRKPSSSARKALVRKLDRVFDPELNPYDLSIVPDDPDRRLLTKEEVIEEYSSTTSEPRGHGFNAIPEGLKEAGRAYYAVSPKPNVILIGIDTINSCGLWNGIVDDAQFKQLDRDLEKAESEGKIAVVVGHHTLETINNGLSCGSRDEVLHFGLKDKRGKPKNGRSESLEELFLRHPNMLAYVSSHEHKTKITSFETTVRPGKFYEVQSPAHADSPSQARLIQIVNNRDCSFSIFTTMVDHLAEPDPGDAPNLSDPLALASIHRLVGENDPQKDPVAYGLQTDRNTELIVRPSRLFCNNFRQSQLDQIRDDLPTRGDGLGEPGRRGGPGTGDGKPARNSKDSDRGNRKGTLGIRKGRR